MGAAWQYITAVEFENSAANYDSCREVHFEKDNHPLISHSKVQIGFDRLLPFEKNVEKKGKVAGFPFSLSRTQKPDCK